MSDSRRLAQELYEIRALALSHATSPQLGVSSVDGEGLVLRDGDGNDLGRIGGGENGMEVEYLYGPKPPQPSAPDVSADTNLISVRWDGLWADQSETDPDIVGSPVLDRVEVHVSSDENFVPDQIESLAGTMPVLDSGGQILVGPLAEAGDWYVVLLARGKDGQYGAPSDRVHVVTSVGLVENELFGLALRAGEAMESADGKNSVYYGDEEPQPTPRLDENGDPVLDDDGNPLFNEFTEGDIWFGEGNMPHVWSDTDGWVSAADQRVDAIQSVVDELESDLDDVRQSADGKTSTFYKPTAPPVAEASEGDLWFDTSAEGGNTPHRFTDGAWVSVADQRVQAVQDAMGEFESDLDTVRDTANGKNRTFYQSTMPATPPARAGDLWFNTANGYRLHRNNGATFIEVADGRIADLESEVENIDISGPLSEARAEWLADAAADAQTKAQNAAATAEAAAKAYADAVATGAVEGELEGLQDYADNAAEQARQAAIQAAIAEARVIANEARDEALAAALDADAVISQSIAQFESDLDLVRESADGKSKITWSPNTPSGDGKAGDTWFRTSGNNIIGHWRHSGSAWVSMSLAATVIPNLDAGKITSGFIDSERIAAGSITADKLLVGGTTNIVPGLTPGTNRGLSTFEWDAEEQAVRADGKQTMYADEPFAVAPGEYVVEADIKASVEGTRTYIGMLGYGTSLGYTYGISNELVSTEWQRHSATLTIPEGRGGPARLRLLPAYSGDADATTWYRNISVRRMTGSTLIEDGAITTGKIQAGAVGATAIAAESIDASKIVAGGIQADSLIVPGTVGGTLIKDGAITSSKIEAGAITAQSGIIASLDAGVISSGTIDAARIQAGSLDGGVVLSEGSVGTTVIAGGSITTEKIATGAITAESGVIGSLDAGKITVGEMDGARIVANTITADKMLVGPRPDNMIVDIAAVTGGTDPHQALGGGTLLMMPGITGVDGYNPGPHLTARSSASPGQGANRAVIAFGTTNGGTRAPVEPSTDYALSALVRVGNSRPHGTPNVHWAYTEYDHAGVSLGTTDLGDSQTVAGWGWSTVAGEFTTQQATSSVEILLSCNQPSTDVRIVKPAFRPKVGTTLISDGAITTEKIAVGAITAESGIIGSLDAGVITTGELRGELIRAGSVAAAAIAGDAIDGKTITGATVRTSAAGARVEMNSTGLFVKNQFGANTVSMQNGAISVEGGTITGGTVRTSASGARVQLDRTGLKAYNPDGDETFSISSNTGTVDMEGNLRQTNTYGRLDVGPTVFASGADGRGAPGIGFSRHSKPSGVANPAGMALREPSDGTGSFFQVQSEGGDAGWSFLNLATPGASTSTGLYRVFSGDLRSYIQFQDNGGAYLSTRQPSGSGDIWAQAYVDGRSHSQARFSLQNSGRAFISTYVGSNPDARTGMLDLGPTATWLTAGAGNTATAARDLYLTAYGDTYMSAYGAGNDPSRDAWVYAQRGGSVGLRGGTSGSDRGSWIGITSEGQATVRSRGDDIWLSRQNGSGSSTWSSISLTSSGISLNISSSTSYGIYMNTLPVNSGATPVGRSNGQLYSISSSRKYKLVEEPIDDRVADFEDKLLSIEAKTWVDKVAAERLAEYYTEVEAGVEPSRNLDDLAHVNRIPGVIAEDLADAGLDMFVHYEDGEPESVLYDRIGPALIPVVRRLRDRVNELEDKIGELWNG